MGNLIGLPYPAGSLVIIENNNLDIGDCPDLMILAKQVNNLGDVPQRLTVDPCPNLGIGAR